MARGGPSTQRQPITDGFGLWRSFSCRMVKLCARATNEESVISEVLPALGGTVSSDRVDTWLQQQMRLRGALPQVPGTMRRVTFVNNSMRRYCQHSQSCRGTWQATMRPVMGATGAFVAGELRLLVPACSQRKASFGAACEPRRKALPTLARLPTGDSEVASLAGAPVRASSAATPQLMRAASFAAAPSALPPQPAVATQMFYIGSYRFS